MPPTTPFNLNDTQTKPPSYRDGFNADLSTDATGFGAQKSPFDIANTELYKQSAETAKAQLVGDTPTFDVQANEARESLKMGQALRQKQIREGMIGAGLRDTGQFLQQGVVDPARQDVRERFSLERGLASDRETLSQQRQQAGQQAASNLLGLQQSGQIAGSQLEQQAGQFQDRLAFDKWATERGYSEAAIERAWQSTEAAKSRTSTEKIAFAGLDVEKQALAQDAMQFDSKLDFDKWALQKGLDENDTQRIWQATQNEKARELSRESLYANLSLEDRKLAQNAEQFTNRLDFDKWAEQNQLDENQKNRIWQSKENLADRMSREEIAYAGLSLEEKKMAQAAEQFDDDLAFREWATQAGLDDAAADRIWKSAENMKAMEHETDITQMNINQDQWKQTQIENLTREGWTHEEAQAEANRTWQDGQNALDRALTREVESGRLSIQEKELAQQATQFESEIAFKTWATEQGLDDASAARAWQSGENAEDRAQKTLLADYDRQLQREAMQQDWDSGTRALAQEASQFGDELDFRKWSTAKGLDEADANRIWEGNEAAKDRAHDYQMRQLDQDFAEKNLNFSNIMQTLALFEPEQARAVLEQVGEQAGIDIPQLTDEQIGSSQLDSIYNKITAGERLGVSDAEKIVSAIKSGQKMDIDVISDGSLEKLDTGTWTTEGTNRWILPETAKNWVAENTGKVYKADNGRLYTVVGAKNSNTRHSTAGIILRDMVTGNEITFINDSSKKQLMPTGGY